MVTNEDLYNNITNNKIYLNISDSNFNQSIGTCLNNNNENNNYDNIFENISLKYIKNNNCSINRIGFTKNKISVKAEHTLDTLDNYKKDSFINELASLLMKNNRDIRNEIKDFVNSNDNLEYLKELTRSYKKFRINIHNILLNENIDKIITDELLTIICKVYDINIIITKDNIYKIYKSSNNTALGLSNYYIFKKYIRVNSEKNTKSINFKLLDTNEDITDYLKNKKKYIDEKELKNMKIDELRKLGNDNNINSNQKKAILVEELSNIYEIYN